MTEDTDDLDKLLLDVRKTIAENKRFLENLVDETIEDVEADDSGDNKNSSIAEESFEEL
jgi:hypothetical protein